MQRIAVIAIISMLVGNLLALLQNNIKRMLAYSSIAHMGYLLIIFIVGAVDEYRSFAIEAASYYLIAYTATTIAAFGLLALLSTTATTKNPTDQVPSDKSQLTDVNGLFWHQPLLACLMLVALLSLAGIPLTAGFIAKFYIFSAAVSGYHWSLLAALIIGSSIGIYYYLRVIFSMTKRPEESVDRIGTTASWSVRSICLGLMASILLLGTIPQPLLEYLRVMF